MAQPEITGDSHGDRMTESHGGSHAHASQPENRRVRRPAFLITVDTEGDSLWSRPERVSTKNAEYLWRFQESCERYGLRPTYLTDWQMANSPVFRDLARDALGRGMAEVGMHLHAWDSPPIEPLTSDDTHHHPYLIEFPEHPMRGKIETLTDRLEQTFGVRMVSHRAGRWAFNEMYARMLLESGYLVDCSVTPHVSWRSSHGAPEGAGGSDYSNCPETPYFVNLDDIRSAGASPLLEVPVTIRLSRPPALLEWVRPVTRHLPFVRRILPKPRWLRPNRNNGAGLRRLVAESLRDGRDNVQFMLHSSELMPGGSPTFDTTARIEGLYRDLERLFALAAGDFDGLTLRQYYDRYTAEHAPRRASLTSRSHHAIGT